MNTPSNAEVVARPALRTAARLGYAAIGLVYLIVGIVAIGAARGRARTTDAQGALLLILHKPFGHLILIVVSFALIGFAVWSVIAAIIDADRRGDDAKALALRVALALRAIAYGILGAEAARIATTHRRSGGGDKTQHWTARVLELPFGRPLIILGGLGLAGYGIYQIVAAVRRNLRKRLDFGSLDASVSDTLIALCRFGIAARGLVFTLMGFFLVHAGMVRDPHAAHGVAGALGTVRHERHGALMLLGLGLGLIAYAVYQFVNSRYRRIAE